MSKVVLVLRVVSILLAMWAAHNTFFALMFRLEGTGDLLVIKQVNLEIGAIFGLAVALFFGPARVKKPWQCLAILALAGGVWAAVSSFLISQHEWQHRVRSGDLSSMQHEHWPPPATGQCA